MYHTGCLFWVRLVQKRHSTHAPRPVLCESGTHSADAGVLLGAPASALHVLLQHNNIELTEMDSWDCALSSTAYHLQFRRRPDFLLKLIEVTPFKKGE